MFAGLGGWGSAFEERGHEVTSIDIEEKFSPTIVADVFDIKAEDIAGYDVILASPPCECFSVLRIGRNWTPPPENAPKTEAAAKALALVAHTVRLIEEVKPRFFVIENPRGKLRRLAPMQHLERVTVTYCQYGAPWQKPTDLWGGFPPSWAPRPECAQGAQCHVSAPRGSRTAVQSDVGKLKDPRVVSWMEQAMRQADSVKRGRNKDGHVNVSKVLGSGDRAAARALVPYELSLEYCLACEEGMLKPLDECVRLGAGREPSYLQGRLLLTTDYN